MAGLSKLPDYCLFAANNGKELLMVQMESTEFRHADRIEITAFTAFKYWPITAGSIVAALI